MFQNLQQFGCANLGTLVSAAGAWVVLDFVDQCAGVKCQVFRFVAISGCVFGKQQTTGD